MLLPEHEAKELLAKAGVPVIPTKIVDSLEDAGGEIERVGYPVALKLSTAEYSHKTDIGGVILNIQDESELARAFCELEDLRDKLNSQGPIIIEPMAPAGAEFFIGIQRHPNFGPVISLGLGGIWLELFGDVTFRLLPADRSDFEEMFTELKSWPKLRDGFRNLPAANSEHMVSVMSKLADFTLDRSDIVEMDLNPIMVYPDRAVVVDARIVIQ